MSRHHLIEHESEIDKLIAACKATGYCSFDFETNAEKMYSAEFTPTLLSISFQPGSGIAIPLNHFESPGYFKKNWKKVIQKIGRAVIEDPNIVKVGWNWKFDNQIMMLYDVYHKGVALDGMLAKYILDEEKPMGLKEMTIRYLPEYGGYENYEGSKLPWDKKPLIPLAKYGCMDTDMTLRLMLFFEKKLMDNGFYSLYRNLIMMASRVLQDTERNGMRLDIPFNQELRVKYSKEIEDKLQELRNIKKVRRFDKANRQEKLENYISNLQDEIDSFKGDSSKVRQIRDREDKITRLTMGEPKTKAEVALFEPINFGSQQQMVQLLFKHPKGFNLPVLAYTKKDKKNTTNPSTAEDALIELKNHDKTGFMDMLLDLRGLQTINSTFVLGLGDKVCPDERIHPVFNIHGCVTEDTILIGKHSDIVIGDIAPHIMGVKDISSRGLEVLTHDGTFQLITHSVNKGYQETWEIETNKGDKLKCTPEHKLYTIQGMKKVRDIIDCNIPIITYDTKYLNVTPKKVYPPVTEVLQEIPNWPGYMVSNMGNVYSTKTKGSQGKAFCEPRKMCIRPNKRGSTRVGLRDNKGYKTMLFVSRLMWETFRGPIPCDYIIDHIDCNPTHNWLNNLQCITKSENIKRAYLNTRNAFSKGSKNGSSKFTTLNIGNILFDISNGVARKDISSKYNISPKQLCRIIKGEAWSHISIDHIKVNKKWPSKLIVDLTVANNHSYVTKSNFINSNTVTGRLSSKDPNFQNLPRPTTNADIKRMMIPSEGCLFLEMDYSQAELRVLAHLAKESTMLEWFRTGKDIHLASACKKYHVEYSDIIKIYKDEQHPEYKTWKMRRKQAKTINFGIAYEQTAMKLSESLSTPEHKVEVPEAQLFLDEFFRDFPNIKKFIQKQHKFAEKHGWVKTMFGRKRRLPNVYSENYREYLEALRFSSNAPIQGTASDFALFSSILMWEEVRKGNFPIFRQCTTVHDSLVFEVKASDINAWLVNSMWNICKNPGTLKYFGFQITDVNMDMDFSVGRNYAEELPFKVGFDYTRMLQPDFTPNELHDYKEPCNYREYSSNIK